jgi:hypothetical protein
MDKKNDKSSKIYNDLRTMMHDVRGSVGIINSSLELLAQEELSDNTRKFLNIIFRQSYRLLTEMELFGEYYTDKPNCFKKEKFNFMETLAEVQEILDIELKIEKDNYFSPTINFSPYFCKITLCAILLPPGGIDAEKPVILHEKKNSISATFQLCKINKVLSRHHWLRDILKNNNGVIKFDLENGTVTLILPKD